MRPVPLFSGFANPFHFRGLIVLQAEPVDGVAIEEPEFNNSVRLSHIFGPPSAEPLCSGDQLMDGIWRGGNLDGMLDVGHCLKYKGRSYTEGVNCARS